MHDVLADALRVVRDEGLLFVPRSVRGAVNAAESSASLARVPCLQRVSRAERVILV